MREYSTALQVSVPTTGNLTDDVVRNGTEHAERVVFSAAAAGRAGRTSRPRSSSTRCGPSPRG